MANRDPLLLIPGSHWQTAGGDHPSEESWTLLARGGLSEENRLTIVDHIVGCPECTRTYRALVSLEEGARELHPEMPAGDLVRAPNALGRPGTRALFGGISFAVAAAALVLLVDIPRASDPPSDADVTRSAAAERLTLQAPLESAVETPTFRWRPLDGAIGYRFELLDATAEPLWNGEVESADEHPWPAGVPMRAGRYYWRVTALLGKGGELTSELASFEIVSGP
ncbi:MAG: hypothetical protein GY946_33270 [bacterium]|nr:hypothetical protein [bacterium]